jgi:hypothetical protein
MAEDSINIGSNIGSPIVTGAARDVIVSDIRNTVNMEVRSKSMSQDDVLNLLTFIKNAIHTHHDLSDSLKHKSMCYLGAATEEAKEIKPDKELMASNLKKVGSTLSEAGKTVESAKEFAEKVAPSMVKLGAWLGTALL